MINKIFRFSLFFAAVAFLAGCEYVETPDGLVPQNYLPVAKKYVGRYLGAVEGHTGALTLTLNGSRALLSFTGDNKDNDILDLNCHSRIGGMKGFFADISNGVPYLRSVDFSFDPGRCQILGREVTLRFIHGGRTIELSILKDQTVIPGTPGTCVPNGGCTGGTPSQIDDHYIFGRFER